MVYGFLLVVLLLAWFGLCMLVLAPRDILYLIDLCSLGGAVCQKSSPVSQEMEYIPHNMQTIYV